MYQNDQQLIKDLVDGNSLAFRYLFDIYYSPLCGYVTNFTSDPDLAEDIVQNSLLIIWRKRKKLHITISLKSYLYKICYNEYIDYYRKNKKIREHLEKLKYEEIERLKENMEADPEIINLKKEKLRKAIKNLPEKCREVFLLNKYEGLTYAEIAEELGISLKTVENHLGNALKRLRKELRE